MLVATVLPMMMACGGSDDDDDEGGGSGSGSSTSTISIVGTWQYYFMSNDPSRGEVYNLVTFNSDHTGYLVEEVGYGSDKPEPFNWTQSGNNITIAYNQSDFEIWTIVQVINFNTAVVSNGKKQFTFYREGTGGGGGSSSGGGSGSGSGGGSGGGSTVTNDTINHPMTVAEIYDIVTAMPKDEVSSLNYCAKGKICSIKYPFSAEYGTAIFNISDTGYTSDKEVTVYSTYYKAFGQKWVEGNIQVAVGDEVVVFGKVENYLGKTPEFADKKSYIVTINGK